MDPSTFDRIRSLVRERAAIVLEPGKEYLVETRLDEVAKSHGLKSIDELGRALDRGSSQLVSDVVEAMTTNETSFFRDLYPFVAMKETILPELIQRRSATKTLEIWCAACSTGQEPYSIAMTIREHFPELASWTIRILGTDISKQVLARAKAARYRQLEVNRGLAAPQLVRFFQRAGLEWELKPEVARMVRFDALNFVEPWPALPRFDIVFLRNVLIYFDVATKRAILERARGVLAEDGYLFLGGAETMPGEDLAYDRLPIPRAGAYAARPKNAARTKERKYA
jgi:chemotaxis protein methyltransferase CheR